MPAKRQCRREEEIFKYLRLSEKGGIFSVQTSRLSRLVCIIDLYHNLTRRAISLAKEKEMDNLHHTISGWSSVGGVLSNNYTFSSSLNATQSTLSNHDNFGETKPELTLPLNLIVQPEIFYLLVLIYCVTEWPLHNFRYMIILLYIFKAELGADGNYFHSLFSFISFILVSKI